MAWLTWHGFVWVIAVASLAPFGQETRAGEKREDPVLVHWSYEEKIPEEITLLIEDLRLQADAFVFLMRLGSVAAGATPSFAKPHLAVEHRWRSSC